jgi:hypothetical protein
MYYTVLQLYYGYYAIIQYLLDLFVLEMSPLNWLHKRLSYLNLASLRSVLFQFDFMKDCVISV